MINLKKINMLLFAIFITLTSSYVNAGQELFKNNNWEKIKNGIPANWRFMTYNGKSVVKLVPKKYKGKKVVLIASDNLKGHGYIGQRTKVQLPPGENIVLSGYYRTEDIAFASKGRLYIDIAYNYGSKDKKFPKKYRSLSLKPSKKWKKFESLRSFNIPIKDFYAFFMLSQTAGKIYFSDLSFKVQKSNSKIDSKEKYIWRDAENIKKYGNVTNWGKEIKDYYSGKGGIILKDDPFKWDFRIKSEDDPDTLKPKKRTYFVWLRMYGYLEKPKVSVFFNKTKISSFKTTANEQLDAKGDYAGIGKYYWQKAGAFQTVGRDAYLNIVPQGRMLIDAIVVTTDSKYAPVKYEAKKVAEKTFFSDINTSHSMKSNYKVYGISEKLTTPLMFRYQGKVFSISNNKKPAIFHFSLPASIEVKNISSHWAGTTWNIPDRWGEKYLTWKKTGTEVIAGVKHNRYEVYIYYLSLTCNIFVQANKESFQPGQKLSCKYYLEYKGKKQLVETVSLHTIAMKPAKAFKTILVGPAGSNARAFYEEFPEIVKYMVFSGWNFVNPWHIKPKQTGARWIKFRDECIKNKIVILNEFTPYWGPFGIKDKKYQAVSLTGESLPRRAALCIDEKDASFRIGLDYLTAQGKQGITGMVLDDETFNQKKDKFDYNPLTKKIFKQYVRKRGISYVDPVEIVKNKKKYVKQYNGSLRIFS